MTEGTTEKSAGTDRAEYHSALANGLVIGRYKILSVLGEGGFGITYRCLDTQLHRDVAIKEYLPSGLAIRQGDTQVLPRSTEVSKDFVWGRSRFLDEARTMAKLSHVPAVVRVHDFLEAHGTAYVVMQLLEGETLAHRLDRETRLSQAAIERILPPLLDGLEQIHGVGFLHRDIKPANIMLGPDGAPTLIDFGASRADVAGRTQAMTAIFTPGFAAPEQSSAGKQGPWTDIYGLAATLYACVTGKPPPSALERLMEDDSAVSADSAGASYAPALLAAIDVGMLLQIHARPQTIDAWRQVLATGVWKIPDSSSWQTQRTIVMPAAPAPAEAPASSTIQPPIQTPAPTLAPAPAKTGHYKPMALAAAAVALLVVGGGAGYAIFAPRAPDAVAPSLPATAAPAAPRANEEASRQAAEARRQAEEQRLAEEAAARERERLQAEQAAAKAAEEEARARAEPGEAELKLTNRDRQKLQVALLSLGFDVGGIDGTFGPRSRQTIAAWQTKNGDIATGFLTAAQRASLMTDAAPAIAKWEEAQRRAYAEEQRRLQQQQQQAPPPPPPPRRGFKWPWE